MYLDAGQIVELRRFEVDAGDKVTLRLQSLARQAPGHGEARTVIREYRPPVTEPVARRGHLQRDAAQAPVKSPSFAARSRAGVRRPPCGRLHQTDVPARPVQLP